MIDVGTREVLCIFAHTDNNTNWIADDVIIGEKYKK